MVKGREQGVRVACSVTLHHLFSRINYKFFVNCEIEILVLDSENLLLHLAIWFQEHAVLCISDQMKFDLYKKVLLKHDIL